MSQFTAQLWHGSPLKNRHNQMDSVVFGKFDDQTLRLAKEYK